MATGTLWQPGGVAAPTDVPNEGLGQWEQMTGVSAKSPLVGGSAYRRDLPYSVDGSRSRVVTTDAGSQATPAGTPGVHLLDTWRDAFNPQSPAFWLLLFILAMLGLMQLRVQARAGKLRLGGGIG